VRQFAAVSPDLFDAVVNLCVEPGKMCASQMMMLDAKGGTGIEGAWNVAALIYDKAGRQQLDPVLPGKTAVIDARFIKAYCANNTPTRAASLEVRAPASLAPLQGAGLAWPVGPLSPANATPEHQPGAHLTLAAPRPLS